VGDTNLHGTDENLKKSRSRNYQRLTHSRCRLSYIAKGREICRETGGYQTILVAPKDNNLLYAPAYRRP
jgi:hypothetical protein